MRFPTTRWSRVLAARDAADAEARDALETLCQTYWHPLYAFVRRLGHTPDQAQDLVQGYFTQLLEKGFLRQVAPELGRFRSFLLASLKNFLSHERDRAGAAKRGGGARLISLSALPTQDLTDAVASELTPEDLFERQWALTVLDQALERLRQEAREAHGEARFEALKPYLTGESQRATYRQVAARLGVSEAAVRTAVVQLRRRFGRALRALVAETVADTADVDDEIRWMLAVIRPWQAPEASGGAGRP